MPYQGLKGFGVRRHCIGVRNPNENTGIGNLVSETSIAAHDPTD